MRSNGGFGGGSGGGAPGAGGTPGGVDTNVQFNDNNTIGGTADLTFNKATKNLKLDGTTLADNGTLAIGGTGIANATAGIGTLVYLEPNGANAAIIIRDPSGAAGIGGFLWMETTPSGVTPSLAVGNLTGASITFDANVTGMIGFPGAKMMQVPVFDAFVAEGSGSYIMQGTGSPEGVVPARVGSLWLRRDGGANTSLYVKESGTGNTGWIAK